MDVKIISHTKDENETKLPVSASRNGIVEGVISVDAISQTGECRDDKSHLETEPPTTTETPESQNKYVVREYADMTTAYTTWKNSIPNEVTRFQYCKYLDKFLLSIKGKRLDSVTGDDVTAFVLSHPTWHTRQAAVQAVRNFLNHALKRPPRTKINLGLRPQPRPIQELSPAERDRLIFVIDCQDIYKRAALRILLETGHRRLSVERLTRDAIQLRPEGPYIIFGADNTKKHTVSVVPITEETYKAIQECLQNHKDNRIFPLDVVYDDPGRWLYLAVKKVAKEARISFSVYTHLFRHWKALQYRRADSKTDTILNNMGWRDAAVFNNRYGRRGQYETGQEARELLTRTAPQQQPQQPEKPQPVIPQPAIQQPVPQQITLDADTLQALLSKVASDAVSKYERDNLKRGQERADNYIG
jgi:integrase